MRSRAAAVRGGGVRAGPFPVAATTVGGRRVLVRVPPALGEEARDQVAVVPRVGMLRLRREGAFVGAERCLERPEAGEGVAEVVVSRGGGVVRAEALRRALDVAGTVAGHRLPARVLEQSRRRVGRPRAQQFVCLLVATLPQVAPGPATRRLPGLGAGDREEQDADERREYAATKAEAGEGEDGKHEPEPDVVPGVERSLGSLRRVPPRGSSPAPRRRVGLQGPVFAVGAARDVGEPRGIQPGVHRGPGGIGQEAPRNAAEVEGNRRALGSADADDGDGEGRVPVPQEVIGVVDAVGNQHDAAMGRRYVGEQRPCGGDGRTGPAAGGRHDLGHEGRQQVLDVAHVVGQRRDDVRIPRVDHQSRQTFPALAQQPRDRRVRPGDSAWRDVAGVHRRRQVQHDHGRVPV